MTEPGMKLGVILDDESLLGSARRGDPVDVVVLRSTFLNPPRGAAARRMGERVHERHPDAELVPYAWHYLTHGRDDGVAVGSNRSLGDEHGSHGHLRGDGSAHAWEITKICAAALDARHVVLRTPSSFSPSSLSRRSFREFLALRGADDPKLVWEPEGLWTPAEAAAFAGPLGVEIMTSAVGMTGQLLEVEGARWLRIQGAKDGRLRSSHAEVLAFELADQPAPEPRILLFDGRRAYANLRAFVRASELL